MRERGTVVGQTEVVVGTGSGKALGLRARRKSHPCPCPCRPCPRIEEGHERVLETSQRDG